jgi:polar amino acid transport system substrate-binding protein
MVAAAADIARRIAQPLALAVLCAGLSAPAAANGTLTLCFENKLVEPWRTVEQSGLNFELLKRVASRLQINFDYELLPWKRCLAKLKANEVDGAFTVSFNDERRQYGAFPGGPRADEKKRMHYARYFLVRKKGSLIDWDGKKFNHLDGKIAFQLGYSVGDMLREQKVDVEETSDALHSVGRKVLAGRLAGAAVMDSDAALLMRGPLAGKLEVVEMPLTERAYYLMLSDQLVRTRPALAEQIWKAIEDVRDSKEYGKLIKAAGAENAR